MYIDTSLLVPYYCPETLSRKAERILRGDAHPAVSDLVEVEFFSALAKKVRAREMLAADATRTGEQFLGHLHAAMYTRIALQRRHYEAARNWLARFASPIRALDALHLAIADGEGLRLATADRDLSRSARRLGVSVTLVRV
ncbi:MAG: type II toxin-antitoxin system VapC family toxin [Candidatus Rokubacteria bacterium]|nr:type II toxin-antitoxin system VapC family toxin [Candidatus Rokubacteria bacterium]